MPEKKNLSPNSLFDSHVQVKKKKKIKNTFLSNFKTTENINPAYNIVDIFLFIVPVLSSTEVPSLKYIFRYYYFSL